MAALPPTSDLTAPSLLRLIRKPLRVFWAGGAVRAEGLTCRPAVGAYGPACRLQATLTNTGASSNFHTR